MSDSAKNKKPVALITGGASRLGKHIAESLLPSFLVVAHFFESDDAANELASSHPNLITIQTDLTLPGAPGKLISQTVEEMGELHLLVNNAALFYGDDADLVQLAKMKALNLDAPIKLMEAARTHLRKTCGQIINIADIAGIHPFKKYKAYSRSKAALIEYCIQNALGLARDQIRINTVCPGLVLPAASQQHSDTLDILQQQIPLQRIGKPEDVAGLVAFLASSDFITGQVITVDGGRMLRYIEQHERARFS